MSNRHFPCPLPKIMNQEIENGRVMQQDPIVTSGESDEGVMDESDEEDRGFQFVRETVQRDALYDENADDDDEAYVYQYLRSGSADPTQVASGKHGGSNSKKIVKPRSSDAVLSCPCCLSIVCMDCQQHDKYENQYRAMFVMNIMVRWDVRLKYDANQSLMVPFEENTSLQEGSNDANTPRVVEDHPEENKETNSDEDVIYYKVCCSNCHTPVASLDMTEEVYHFYGCVASA